ncbi:hypothetical protein WJX72_005224 [[Myrmecia] bisecta]|uniref:Uncharacterized protein n=1 Tax=[Myrmecia] bisecta TaxID=41462 RepID=A0AAW1QQM3_9CHLO
MQMLLRLPKNYDRTLSGRCQCGSTWPPQGATTSVPRAATATREDANDDFLLAGQLTAQSCHFGPVGFKLG